MKKIVSIVLALALVLLCVGAAMADNGTLTIENATASQDYVAYKIFSAEYTGNAASSTATPITGVVYTIAAAKESLIDANAPFEISTAVGQNGEHIINKKTTASDQDVIDWLKDNYSSFDATGTALTYNENGTATSSLPYGYYYITSSLGTAISVDTLNSAVSVKDKNPSTPTGPDKEITAEDSSVDEALDGSGYQKKLNEAGVGSVETFTVDFNATNWKKAAGNVEATRMTVYNFKDTPVGLDINTSSFVVTVNYGTSAAETVTVTPVKDANGVVTFDIPWVDGDNFKYQAQAGNGELIPVHITYTATVTAAAATVVAPNEVKIAYNNDPDNNQLGEPSTTTTKTYKFKLLKTDATNNPLLGAEFELYYGDGTGSPLHFTMVEAGVYRYDASAQNTHIAPVGDNAQALILGLDDASYTLKEVVVPAGYNKAADKAVTGLSPVDAADAAITTVTVVNNQGTELPSTGGIGTTIFYILGGLLVIGAAVILVARRKAQD